ncbi:MAG: hypothetical protein Q9194_000968 [Teloschistes cf. exilis]
MVKTYSKCRREEDSMMEWFQPGTSAFSKSSTIIPPINHLTKPQLRVFKPPVHTSLKLQTPQEVGNGVLDLSRTKYIHKNRFGLPPVAGWRNHGGVKHNPCPPVKRNKKCARRDTAAVRSSQIDEPPNAEWTGAVAKVSWLCLMSSRRRDIVMTSVEWRMGAFGAVRRTDAL